MRRRHRISGSAPQQALYAVLAALGGILLYIWVRFDLRGGVATIVSVGHDVLICLGALSLTNREFSLSVLAALLTVIGFAVNDRIVMYDRLREIRAKKVAKAVTFAEQVNLAVNQTLSRTVLTVATVVLSAAMLFLFGGASLENFALVSWWARSPVHCRRSMWRRRSTWTGRHGSRGGGRHGAERRSAVGAEWRGPETHALQPRQAELAQRCALHNPPETAVGPPGC